MSAELLRRAADHLDACRGSAGRPWHHAVMHEETSENLASLLRALARAVELSGVAEQPGPLSIHERGDAVARTILGGPQ